MKKIIIVLGFALAAVIRPVSAGEELQSLLDTAAANRRDGNLHLAIDMLERALRTAGPNDTSRIAGELGVTYYQAHRFDEAEAKLKDAYQNSSNAAARARYANDLGNLNASRGLTAEARRYFEEAHSTTSVELRCR